MADAQLKLSRRALLGAACACHPGLDPGPMNTGVRGLRSPSSWIADQVRNDGDWQEALAAFRSAEAAVAALEGGPDEDAFGRAHDRFNAALRRLLSTPSPDLPALAAKLEIAAASEAAEATYAPPDLARLAADARELAVRSS